MLSLRYASYDFPHHNFIPIPQSKERRNSRILRMSSRDFGSLDILDGASVASFKAL